MALNKDRIAKAADKYIRANKIEKAIAEYESWLKENPKDWNTIRIVGDLYARISRNDEAIKKYAQVAEHYRRDGFNVRAIATYKMVLRLDPGNESAMRNLAELQAEEGLLMEAKSYYQTLVELYNKQGHKRLASEVFKKLADIDPQDLRIRYKYAEFLTKQGKTEEAASEFVGIADQFIGQGKVDEAVKILEQGRTMAPTDASLSVKLAQALSLQGNHDKAIELLEEVRAANAGGVDALGQLGEAYLAAGKTQEAETALQQLLDLDPDNPANATRLAELRIAQGKFDPALEQLIPLVDRQVAEGDSRKANELLQKILGKNPYHVKTLLKLAEMYTILKQDTGRISAYDGLCEAYSKAGDFEKAAQVAEQLVELDPEGSQHKDRLKFFKSKLTSATRPAAPEAASAPPAPASLPADQDLPELDLEADDLGEAVSVSFDDELSFGESAGDAAPVVTADLGDVVELTQEDEENIKEKLTEAEVFVRYGLVDKAIAQLVDVLESFRFHVESREKLIEIYKDQGMNRESAEQLVHLAQVYDKLGRPEEAERARVEAGELNPALATRAPAASGEAHDELELTLESEADLSDAGIEIDVPPPAAEPAVDDDVPGLADSPELAVEDEIPVSLDDASFEESEIDISIDDPEEIPVAEASKEDVALDVDLTGEEVDFLAGGEPRAVVEEGAEDVSVSFDDAVPEVDALEESGVEPELALDGVAADEDIEIDLEEAPDEPSTFPGAAELESEPAPESDVALDADELDLGVGLGDAEAALSDPALEEPVGATEEFSMELEDEASEMELSVELPEPEPAPGPLDAEETFGESLESLSDDEDAATDIELEIPEPEMPVAETPEEVELPAIEEPLAQPAPEEIQIEEPVAAVETTGATAFASELAEVDEYITLGLYEDARDTLRELLKQHPGETAILGKVEELGFSAEQLQREAGERAPLVAPAASAPAAPAPEPAGLSAVEEELFQEAIEETVEEPLSAEVGGEFPREPAAVELDALESLVAAGAPEGATEEDGFIDLASELSEEIFGTHSAVEDDEPEGPLTDPGLDQIFREFRKGVEKQLGTEDYDTRYNLGIAYKEMGLLDEAIAEFQLAAKDEVRGLECCSMLGLCFMEKGMPDIAIKWFAKGLDIPGRREEEYHGLRYDLAQAYEAANQPDNALSLYKEIFRENASFRDVKERVRELTAARK